MEIPGLPYSEPSFSSISLEPTVDLESCTAPDVLGVAYLITADQYRRVLASEGGGIAYTDICLAGEPLDKELEETVGPRIMLRTLRSAVSRRPVPHPSKRYMVRVHPKSLRFVGQSN